MGGSLKYITKLDPKLTGIEEGRHKFPTPVLLLETPMGGGAWWAAIYGVTQSRIQLKQLSSSSSIDTEDTVYLEEEDKSAGSQRVLSLRWDKSYNGRLVARNQLLQSRLQYWASQVALVVKILPANAGDARDTGSIPGLGRSPGGGHGNPL